jgi:Family of unknown function (DUF6012)
MTPPFIYHLRPRIFCPGLAAQLIDLRIDRLGIHLRADELATGRPYRNKWYKVGRRRIGRKAVDGILLDLSQWPPDFQLSAQWAIEAEYVATHNVTYKLLDKDFTAASDDMTKWYATAGWDWQRKFENRFPEASKSRFPRNEPCMEVMPKKAWPGDILDRRGLLIERTEVFALPTIEPERFLGDEYPRDRIALPTLAMALKL